MQTVKEVLQSRSKYVYLIIMIPMISLCVFNKYVGFQRLRTEVLFQNPSGDYIIYTPKCRIIKLEAFNEDAKKYYERKSYYTCSKMQLLSKLIATENATVLEINKKLVPKYSKNGITCCYSNITRGNSKGKHIDNDITRSKCKNFEGYNISVSPELVLEIKCKNSKTKREVYKNIHMPIAKTKRIKEKMKNFQSKQKPISVLIVGIDSISRLNMIRTMPKTRKYLKSHPNWMEYEVYHKIDDNTFPNLIAMLTGLSPSTAWKECNPRKVSGIDRCNFIWKSFNRNNYVTAYVEDSAQMSTFNYLKEGFSTPPTDFYARAYQLACNDLKRKYVDNAMYCSGPEMEGERIFRMSQEFVRVFNDTPYFAFFWVNSFSHQQLNTPTRLDQKVAAYIEDITKTAGEHSVILFLSDHGIRFGNIRHSLTGYLEERLPYFFVSVPKWFRQTVRTSFQNLQDNREKLVTPYDIYMSLQDVLVLSGANHTKEPSKGCANCKSIFDKIDINRSCEESSIPERWCTCYNFKNIGTDTEFVRIAGQMMIDNLHLEIAGKNATEKCSKYTLNKIVRVFGSQTTPDFFNDDSKFIVIIETKPKATFEATFHMHRDNATLRINSGFSRLDSYSSTGKCVSDSYLKLLCYCT